MPRDKAIATVAVIVGFFLLIGVVVAVFFAALFAGLMMAVAGGH
jgi:hypothetical protein